MKTKKKKKTIKYANYKTTTGYVRAVAKEMKDVIIEHYKNYKPIIKEMRTEHPAYERTDDEIVKLFIKQVKASYEGLKVHRKLKDKELLHADRAGAKSGKKAKKSKKRWATAAGAKRAIKSALMSGGFANIDLIYGQNVLETLKDAGMERQFRRELAWARKGSYGGRFKYGDAPNPKGFRPDAGAKGKAQTVIYSEEGTDLIEIELTWSPAAATITNMVTGRSTTQLIEDNTDNKQEETKDVD